MKEFRDLFTYSANERYGLIVLVFLLLAVSGYNMWLARHSGTPPEVAEEQTGLFAADSSPQSISGKRIYQEASWQRQKQYVPYKQYIPYKKSKPEKIEINTADSADFEHLPGIGGILARRILRYRGALGGFYDPAQIREVYGISDSVFALIEPRLRADTSKILKINLNAADEKMMARHPYIGRYAAKGIAGYRKTTGMIRNLEELKANGLIEKDQLDRLKFYVFL
jgi:competence protein ComEA